MAISEFRVGGLYRIKDPDYIDFFDTDRMWIRVPCGGVLMYLYSIIGFTNGDINMFLYEDKIIHCYTRTNDERMFPFAWFKGEVGKDEQSV